MSASESYSTAALTTLSISAATGVLTNDSDANSLSAELYAPPSHGELRLLADGSFDYTPSDGFVGTDTFSYRANDGQMEGDVTLVTIAVVNQAPTAQSLSIDVIDGAAATVSSAQLQSLLSDPDASQTLSTEIVLGPENGTLSVEPDGAWSYQPNADFTGTESITFVATDGVQSSDSATITFDVNYTPESTFDRFSTALDTPLTLAAGDGLLVNDLDSDNDLLSVIPHGQPNNGNVTIWADGSFTYTPNTGFVGVDSFSYVTTDGALSTEPTLVVVEVALPTLDGISARASHSSVVAGDTILISGNVLGDYLPDRVTVNGETSAVIDANGRFFAEMTVRPGINTFTVATETLGGEVKSTEVTVVGRVDRNELAEGKLVEVNASVEPRFGRTSWFESRDLLWTDLAVENIGSYDVGEPLWVGIKNISSARVSVLDPDGFTDQGVPYFDYTDFVDDGVLSDGDVSLERSIAFNNPERIAFTFDLVVFGTNPEEMVSRGRLAPGKHAASR
ncbi:MAG: Ig-like domain-containing protein, partial [Planctomycetota bacterium]